MQVWVSLGLGDGQEAVKVSALLFSKGYKNQRKYTSALHNV